MKLINNIRKLFSSDLETRDSYQVGSSQAIPSWLTGNVSDSGETVTEQSAMSLTSVYAAISCLSSEIASLPLYLYEKLPDGGSKLAENHPLFNVLNATPNPAQSRFTFIETSIAHLLMSGNFYYLVNRNNAGRINNLWLIQPNRMSVFVDMETLEPIYRFTMENGKYYDLKVPDICHVPYLGTSGYIGLSPIQICANALGLELATQKYGAMLFKNGARPSLSLETDKVLTDEAYTRLQSSVNDKYSGVSNAAKIFILEDGLKASKMSLDADEAQFIQTRNFSVLEVCRIFKINPYKLYDYSRATFSNIEQSSMDYYSGSIRPICERLESTFNTVLLTPSERSKYFIQFDVKSILRGDLASRYTAYAQGINAGFISRNEVRAAENMAKLDGLDEILTPLNMAGGENIGNQDKTKS